MSESAEDRRWMVEASDGDWHDVGAERLDVSGGCLVFYDSEGLVLLAYPVGGWLSVTR